MQIFNKAWTTDPKVQWAAMPDKVIVIQLNKAIIDIKFQIPW